MADSVVPGRFRRPFAALLTVSMAAVVLTVSPAAAADSPGLDNADATASIVGEREPDAQSRTTSGSVVARPEFTNTPCPEMTDSIYRLYTAYFGRVPDQGGFEFWATEYSAGIWSLPRMSTFFSESDEFVRLYGRVSDAEFVEMIYASIFGRLPDPAGHAYWLGRMANEGLDRGTVMLNFSESPEYVDQLFTSTPLAGYFNWYPEGTEWSCGVGNIEAAIPDTPTYADFVIYNPNRGMLEVSYSQLVDGQWELATVDTIEPQYMSGFFAVPYLDGSFGGIRMEANDEFVWTIVFSPLETPGTRSGWTPT